MIFQKSLNLVCICSVASFITTPFHGAYSSSKSAIKMIFDSWRPSLNIFNIKTVTICPGFIDTPMITGLARKFPMKSADIASEKFLKIIEKEVDTYIYPYFYKMIIYFYKLIPKQIYNMLITKIFSKPIS